MRVSCILPVYNAGPFLRAAIDSILKQSYEDFELIIIDDKSTDDSWSVISEYQEKYPNIINSFRNTSNVGLPGTLNKAIKLANGEFIARMDQDDIAYESRFEEQVFFLKNNPKIAVVGTYWQYMNTGNVPQVPVEHDEIKLFTLLNNPFGHPTVMFRKKEVTEAVGLYNEQAHTIEDFEFWCRCLDKVKTHNIPSVLLDYRIHSTQISSSSSVKQGQNLDKLRASQVQKVLKFRSPSTRFVELYDLNTSSLFQLTEFSLLSFFFALANVAVNTFSRIGLSKFLLTANIRKIKNYTHLKRAGL